MPVVAVDQVRPEVLPARTLRSKIASATRQLELLGDELGRVSNLHKLGLARKLRLLGLKRRKTELEAQREQDSMRLKTRCPELPPAAAEPTACKSCCRNPI